MASATKDAVVIGAGFAGLSSAVALAERGVRVTVIEGKPALGGRAYSFEDPDTGDFVDNGQHLFMGCYRETLKFLQRIGSLGGLAFQTSMSIPFVGAGRVHATLRCLPLPSPPV